MARRTRPPLSKTRKQWAEERGGAVFRGTPLTHPSLPEARYQARLDRMVEQMTETARKEVERFFRSQWTGDSVAMDASFTSGVSRLLNELSKRFTALFTERAGGLAEALSKGVSDATARQLGQSLKDVSGGVTLKTDVVSGAVAEVSKAGIKENVALIKSIPAQYFQHIEGDVMRSIQTGQGMKDLVADLMKHGAETKKRAELIARDQTSKATTAINRARMQGLGIKQFQWLHSGGGKEPRPLHQALDGQVFDLDNPPVIDERTGERGLPGQLINCFTGSTKVSLANGCRNLWRYRHEGEVVRLSVMGDLILEATPNHPVLTGRGWLPAHEVQEGDYLASTRGYDERVVDGDNAENTVTFRDLHVALVLSGNTETVRAAGEFDFHGDIPKNDVDSVLVEENLSFRLKAGGREEVKKLILSAADSCRLDTRAGLISEVLHSLGAGVPAEGDAILSAHGAHADKVSLVPVAQEDPVAMEHVTDDLARTSVEGSDSLDAHAPLVHLDDSSAMSPAFRSGFLRRKDIARLMLLESAGEVVGADLVALAETLESFPFVKGFHRVSDKSVVVFSGHVYTMETDTGWYPLASTETVSKNCRCRMVPVISFGEPAE